jgi:hypothetical protein
MTGYDEFFVDGSASMRTDDEDPDETYVPPKVP